jgi:transporter family protein
MGAGKASIVVPLTALYPVVTIILSYLILGERISPLKGVGTILALFTIILMSID